MKWFGEFQRAFIYKSREILNREILLQITSAHLLSAWDFLTRNLNGNSPQWHSSCCTLAQKTHTLSCLSEMLLAMPIGYTCENKTHRGADFLSLPLSLSHTLPHLLLPLSGGESQPGPCIPGKWAFIEPQFLPTCDVDWFASQCYSEAKDAESGVDLKLKNTTLFGATVQAKRSLKQFACISCWLKLHSLCCCC